MDAVITYVNGKDPLWLEDYRKYVNSSVNAKRFRDWGTLKYLLRGIEKHMPYVRNVYLVVSRESQVPEWADRENLHIILHEDIIPETYLPTFNCNTIELFLHRIPGIDEEFLNFNDDIFPVSDSNHDDFFENGMPVVHHARCLLTLNLFKKMARNTDRKARAAAGAGKSLFFVRPQHTVSAMLKSVGDEIFEKMEPLILESLSRCREEKNILQYLFSDYLYYQNRTVRRKISNRHFSLAASSENAISSFLESPDRKFVCINDVNMSDEKYERMHSFLIGEFQKVFPDKSKFEK